MTSASRARFAEVVRAEPVDVGLAALLIAVEAEPLLDVDEALAALDQRATDLGPLVLAHPAAEALQVGLAGFYGTEDDFADLRASLLPEVLRRRRGLPILLSIVWVEVAARLGIAASYAAVPGRVVVVIGDLEDEHTVMDAFAGTVHHGDVLPMSGHDVLLRLLTNIRAWAAGQPRTLDAARTRLWATELSLLLPTHPVELRRERAELLVRLGCFADGAEGLEAYADVIEGVDTVAAQECRVEARQARSRLN